MGNQWEYPGLVTIITNNSQIIVLGKFIIYLSDLIFRQNGVIIDHHLLIIILLGWTCDDFILAKLVLYPREGFDFTA